MLDKNNRWKRKVRDLRMCAREMFTDYKLFQLQGQKIWPQWLKKQLFFPLHNKKIGDKWLLVWVPWLNGVRTNKCAILLPFPHAHNHKKAVYTPFIFKLGRKEQIPQQQSKAFTETTPPSDLDLSLNGSHSTTSSCKGGWGIRGDCYDWPRGLVLDGSFSQMLKLPRMMTGAMVERDSEPVAKMFSEEEEIYRWLWQGGRV